MNILMLGWELPPHNSGGLGVACLQLSKALAAGGADIDFILPYSIESDFGFMNVIGAIDSRVPVGYLPGIYDSHMYGNETHCILGLHDQQELYARRVCFLAERLEFDVVHAHDWLTFRAALMLKEKFNRPVVLHVHSVERDRAGGQPGNPFVRAVEEQSLLLADHIFTVSQRTKRMILEDYGVPDENIEVAYNSIDTDGFPPLDSDNSYNYLEFLKRQGWRIVVNAGRLTVQKGLTQLLEAAAKVVQHQPKTLFLIVGSGEQRDELVALAAEKHIAKNVIFAGFQRGKRLRDAYAVADLFVMPSVSEPFGLTPFEAAGYGTPALISYQSGAAEILKNCLKVDFWDTDLMADKIVGALRSQPILDELSRNSRLEFERLSWGRTADKIISRYKQVAETAA